MTEETQKINRLIIEKAKEEYAYLFADCSNCKPWVFQGSSGYNLCPAHWMMVAEKSLELHEPVIRQKTKADILEIFQIWKLKEFGINVSQSPKFKLFEEKINNLK